MEGNGILERLSEFSKLIFIKQQSWIFESQNFNATVRFFLKLSEFLPFQEQMNWIISLLDQRTYFSGV